MMTTEAKNLPHGWRWVKLGEVCEVTKLAGFEYTEHVKYCLTGEYIALRAQNVRNSGLDLQNVVYITKETASHLSRSKLSAGDVVMTFIGANIGEATCIDTNDTFYCAPNIAKITPNPKIIYHQFLARVIHSPIIRQQIEALNKSTAQPSLSMENIRDFYIVLPPLAEQKRIAAIAQKADRLRRTRSYALQLSDTYLQSVFLEMFGELVTNPKGWRFQELVELADIASGVTKGQNFNGKKTVEVPYLRVANVQDGYLDLSEIKTIQALPSEIENLRLEKGDVLMTEGGDFDKLGRGAIWNCQIENCIHQNHIFRVRTNSRLVLPNFFAAFLLTRYSKTYFLKCSKQTTNLATINMTQLKGLPVPLPPLPLQEKFVQIVQKFERLRTQQREGDRQAEHLFQTLLHRAFRGELTPQDANDEPASVLLEQIGAEQAKAEAEAKAATQAMGDAAEYLGTKAKQQDTETIQLTLPGIE
jgi:type I restriction enzyme S subunit